MNRVGECGCSPTPTLVRGGLDASETIAIRGGVAEYAQFGPYKRSFLSFAEKYSYLRGKAACSGGAIQFPCCSATTQACDDRGQDS